MRRMSSSVAMSPAMTAAGSPGVRYRSENTTNATTAITTTVENRRRTMYAIVRGNPVTFDQRRWVPACAGTTNVAPLALLDIPHERHRRNDHAGKVRAVRRRQNELRRRNVGHEFEGALLHRVGGLFRAGRV